MAALVAAAGWSWSAAAAAAVAQVHTVRQVPSAPLLYTHLAEAEVGAQVHQGLLDLLHRQGVLVLHGVAQEVTQ